MDETPGAAPGGGNREQQAREWIKEFLAASDEDRIANVRLMLAGFHDAARTIVRERARERAMTPMTPEKAAENAAKALDLAVDEADRNPGYVNALIAVADAWTRLHTALANAHQPVEPEPRGLTEAEELAKLREAYRILLARVAQVEEVRDIAGQPGNWDTSSYQHGYCDGLERAAAILDDDREPRFRRTPEGGYRFSASMARFGSPKS